MEQALNNNYTKTKPAIRLKKCILTVLLLVLGLLIVSAPGLYGLDEGYKFIRNYSFLEYDHQPQNWGMTQAESGILFFANLLGVLEYDGVSWRVHYMGNIATRSLAVDKGGTIFVGGENSKIWRLAPDANGNMEFISLVPHLDENDRVFGTVYGTHAIKDKVYFRTSNYLFIWDHKKMTILKAASTFKASFVYNGQLIVQVAGKGLMKVAGHDLEPLPGGEFFGGKRIAVFTPFSGKAGDGKILVGTRKPAFFLYDGEKATPFPAGAGDHLTRYMPNHGTRLSSGDFALATNKGLVIVSPEGKIKNVFDTTSGLQSENVKYVFRDTWGTLWLCLDYGISKIEYHSPFSVINSGSNLRGIVMTVVRHKNELYIGTRNGLYRKSPDSRFYRVPGTEFSWNSLISSGGHLLAATQRGVLRLDDNTLVNVTSDLAVVLVNSKRFEGLVWCGTEQGALVALEYRNGQWREKLRLDEFKIKINNIVETGEGELWLGTSGDKVFKIRFPNGFRQPEITTYGATHELRGNESYVAEIAGHIVVATTNGLFQYDRKGDSFIPDPVLGEEFAGGEHSRHVFRLIEDRDRNIWFSSESKNYLAVPGKNGGFKIKEKPLRRMPETQVNAIYPDPAGKTTWFANHDGLYKYDTTVKKDYEKPFTTLIRKVVLNENTENRLEIFNAKPGETINTNSLPAAQIEYKDRNLYFEYAAPFFEAEAETQYECFLEGYDSGWTAPNKEAKRYYTNLDAGSYRFRVRAINVYGTKSREASYRFRILLPWYRTWWMVAIYFLFIMFSIYQVMLWRSVKLEKDKKKLEAEVNERTKEIDEKNRQLRNQSEKLKEMDKVKSRFFANISHEFRTPLTLILGPLEQMHWDGDYQKDKKKIDTMLRNSQRLLNLINQLLDLSRLDSGKEKLRAADQNIVPFLKGVTANFETAAEQKKLHLEFHAEDEEIRFYYDNQKMEKVMNNLLINAIKYTPPGGNITVSVFKSPQEPEKNTGTRELVKISVKDTGAGIPPDQINSIFDRFFQAERFKTRSGEGTGIGLALAKEYVEMHHGNIDVHSLEGKGTDFVLRFPSGPGHLEPGQIITGPEADTDTVTAQPYTGVETAYETGETVEIENGGDAGAGEVETDAKPTILVVEDNKDVRRYICEPLEADYTVVEAVDGEDGIEKAKKIIPDLVVSDIMMPGKDGYELCQTLKKDIKTSHVPIILLTAKASEESVLEGFETGADDYITKPFNTRILLTRIKNLVELRSQFQLKIQKQMLLQPDEIKVSSMDREFINELKDAIEKNMSDPDFGVGRLSKIIIMDRSTLLRKIKALTGESPQTFIRSFRLQRAAELLEKKFGTVSQVAMEVGFTNVSYFTQCFKEKFHQLPSTYLAAESREEIIET
jgi:signal transduction histidine kinase/DNA-binding NarL/FixJ family response regulator